MRPRPEPKVQDWVAAQDVGTLFMSVVSIGELEKGSATTRTPRGLGTSVCGTCSAGDAGDCRPMGQA